MIGYLSRAFTVLNEFVFEGELNEDMDFFPNLSRKCIFHFTAPNTIEIGFLFVEASKSKVIDDLVHVMIHIYHNMRGVQDYTVNQYHNRHFSDMAIHLGMFVLPHKTRGWSVLISDPRHEDVVGNLKVRCPSSDSSKKLLDCTQQIQWSELEFQNFKSKLRHMLDSKPHKECQLKYTCTSCDPPVIVRSGRRPDGQKPLDINCNVCGTKFVLSSDTE